MSFTVKVTNGTTATSTSSSVASTSAAGAAGSGRSATAGYRTAAAAAPTDFTLKSLMDDRFGDLNGQGDCAVPQTIPAGSSYTCTFTGTVTGSAGSKHVNVVSAQGDFPGAPPVAVQAQGDATVELLPGVPSLALWWQVALLAVLAAIGGLRLRRRRLQG